MSKDYEGYTDGELAPQDQMDAAALTHDYVSFAEGLYREMLEDGYNFVEDRGTIKMADHLGNSYTIPTFVFPKVRSRRELFEQAVNTRRDISDAEWLQGTTVTPEDLGAMMDYFAIDVAFMLGIQVAVRKEGTA